MSETTILMDAPEGRHHANWDETKARLERDATWKHQRIVMILPAHDMIPAVSAMSMMDLIWPPNQGVARILALGKEVGHAYSSTIENVLGHPHLKDWEYILTVEDDNVPPRDGVLQLIRSLEKYKQFAAMSGLYYCKGEGGCAHIWGDVTDMTPNYRPQIPIPNSVQECYGISMGFALWRLSMFKDPRLKRPFFRTKASREEGMGTQDLAFWGDSARQAGYRCAVDTACRVGHHDITTGITW